MFALPIVGTWPNISSNKFKFKNCFFGAPNVVKISDKEKFVYSGYGITFDDAVPWSFDNDYAWDVTIFGVDNSSSSHRDNFKNNFLILGEVSTYGINRSFESPEKGLVLILLRQIQNFVWVCITMLIIVINF